MHISIKRIIIFICFLGLAGCSTNYGSNEMDDFGRYQNIEKNKSTKQDIFNTFAQPHDVTYFQNQESVWRYYKVSMTTAGATFIPIIGLFAGGNNVDYRVADFYFGADGKLLKFETRSKSQYVNMYVGMATVASDNDELGRVAAEMKKFGLPFDLKLAQQMKGTADLYE